MRARCGKRVLRVMNRLAAIAISSRYGKPTGNITNYPPEFRLHNATILGRLCLYTKRCHGGLTASPCPA